MNHLNSIKVFNTATSLAVIWLIMFIVAACSSDEPPIAMAKDYLQKAIDTNGQGRIKLVGFNYITDKQVNYGSDDKAYAVIWKAHLEFLQDSYWPVDEELMKTAPANQASGTVGKSKLRKKGEQVAIEGRYDFDKDNNVWTIIGSEYLLKNL
jgi:hypothetical protein